jgi:hypothetical protein
MSGCAVTDCPNSAVKRGWCALHYQRWRKHGDPLRERPDVITRLLDRSAPVGGCRVYGGALDKDGYAVVKHAGKSHRAVRVIWEAEFGSIPPGLQVCHACDNPPCIERSHLMLGTQAANVRDAIAKGRRPARRAA